jgi:hypothetical protein
MTLCLFPSQHPLSDAERERESFVGTTSVGVYGSSILSLVGEKVSTVVVVGNKRMVLWERLLGLSHSSFCAHIFHVEHAGSPQRLLSNRLHESNLTGLGITPTYNGQ